ncbi:hypothetical protein L484_008437 [Morus notabilis]|uniref:Uncharacterized protein n=1 Tax=Morus notabilis TaxID=981085 RepID=W9S389_9ROSA|nr:hypothetical protein L484_008437 [Morus notabilis]
MCPPCKGDLQPMQGRDLSAAAVAGSSALASSQQHLAVTVRCGNATKTWGFAREPRNP